MVVFLLSGCLFQSPPMFVEYEPQGNLEATIGRRIPVTVVAKGLDRVELVTADSWRFTTHYPELTVPLVVTVENALRQALTSVNYNVTPGSPVRYEVEVLRAQVLKPASAFEAAEAVIELGAKVFRGMTWFGEVRKERREKAASENVHNSTLLSKTFSAAVEDLVLDEGLIAAIARANAWEVSADDSTAGKGVDILPPANADFGAYVEKKAVVIGISKYHELPDWSEKPTNQMTDLRFAARDAEAFADFLRNDKRSGSGWDVTLLLDEQATTRRVDRALSRVLRGARSVDLIYVFFSGHARPHVDTPKDVYLLTHDFEVNTYVSGIDYSRLQRLIQDSPAAHIVAFIDACHSGQIGGRGDGSSGVLDNDLLGERIRRYRGMRILFTSARGTQISYEYKDAGLGIFTHFLLEALTGSAPETRNPLFVDLGEVESYVRNHVEEYTRKEAGMTVQTPQLFATDGVIIDSFPLSLRSSGD